MSRSKKIYLIIGVLFISLLVLVSIDISKRTTFPGSTPRLKKSIQDTYIEKSENAQDGIKKMQDTAAIDSIKKQISD
jgi:hypothetical protein